MSKPDKQSKNTWKWVLFLFLGLLFAASLIVFSGYNMLKNSRWVEERVQDWLRDNLHPQAELRYTPIRGTLFGDIIFDRLHFDYPGVLKVNARNLELNFSLRSVWRGEPHIKKVSADSLGLFFYAAKDSAPPGKEQPFDLHEFLGEMDNPLHLDSALAGLPVITLDELEIEAAALSVEQSELQLENVVLRASGWTRPGAASFDLKKGALNWPQRGLQVAGLSFKAKADSNGALLQDLLLESNVASLAGSVELVDGAGPRFKLDFGNIRVSGKELGRLTQSKTRARGGVQGALKASGRFTDFELALRADGSWAGYNWGRAAVEGAYRNGRIQLKKLDVNGPLGKVRGNGLFTSSRQAKGELYFDNINLNNIDTALAVSHFNGNVNFDLSLLELSRPAGTAGIVLLNSHYDQYRVDSLRFALNGDRDNLKIVAPSFVKFDRQARFDLRGDLSGGKRLNVQVITERGDLNSLLTAVGVDSIYGRYHADVRLFGNLKNPNLNGRLWISDFSYDEVQLDSMALDVLVTRLLEGRKGSANFIINEGMAYGIPVRDSRIQAAIEKDTIRVSKAAIYSNENFIETALTVKLLSDEIEISLQKLRLEYEQYWLKSDSTFYVHITDSAVDVPAFDLHGPQNALLRASGRYDKIRGDARAEAGMRNVRLEPFKQFMGERHIASGELSGYAFVDSILTEPVGQFNLDGKELVYNGVELGQFRADVDYARRKIFIRDLFIKHDSSLVEVTGDLNLNLEKKRGAQLLDIISDTRTDLQIRWDNVKLGHYASLLPLRYAMKGEVSGYIEVEGTVNDPFMRQSLRASRFSYDKFNVDSLVMFGQYSGGYLILDSLSAVFNKTSFSAKGWQQLNLTLSEPDTVLLDNPFELALHSKDNQISFIGLFNEQVEYIRGDHEMDLQLGGTLEKPSISRGQIKMNNGSILLSRVRDPIKRVTIDATIEDNLLTFNNVRGRSERKKDWLEKGFDFLRRLWSQIFNLKNEEGTVYVDGTIDLEQLLRPRIDLDLRMKEFYVDYFIENTTLLLTSNNLRIYGRDTIMVQGRITVPEGDYEVILDEMSKNVYLTETNVGEAKPPFIAADLRIDIPGNFVVASSALDLQNNFKLTLSGDLNVVMPPGAESSQITGVMQTESGKFTTFNQSFSIVNGTIDFNDPNEINPDLNILAEKRQRDKIFKLTISGNLDNIRQNIAIVDQNTGQELTLSEQDKIALLTLGTDISGLGSNADSALIGIGEDVASNTLLTAVERGAENLTGLDRIEISSTDRLLNLQKLKLNNGLSQASISFGKYLTSDLYVEYRTRFGSGVPTPKLSWDAGNRIALEYRINRFWSLESYYEKTVPLGNDKVQLGVSWQYDF